MSDLSNTQTPYRVLARKYRPQHFDELRGQDALVRTLKNAISSGRLAQAYMLTGVRGVGKTTTARIIARAINYVGPDGNGSPTTGPTDDCPIAQAIAQDRCPDVIEMDAASHTGVDDIREIIEGVRYAPTMARYKVYIIDEVHMLSKAAFNALLKTLEEPPAHAKFIFATTEIRKVPMTILSRCQRFDLRRFDDRELQDHLADICARENVTAEENALRMIARAGNGSARDGLSILDQAIALGDGTVRADIVSSMLGLVDSARVADLLASALSGNIQSALGILSDLYKMGAEPAVVVEDLLGLTHALIKARVTGDGDALSEAARDILTNQTLPALSRAWQVLLRSLGDVQIAPDPFAAAEMAVIRLGYASTLPDPTKLMRTLSEQGGVGAASIPAGGGLATRQPETVMRRSVGDDMSLSALVAYTVPAPTAMTTLEDVVALLEHHGQMILATTVTHYVRLIKLEPGRIEFAPADNAPPKLAGDLGAALQQITGDRWVVALGRGDAQDTVATKRRAAEDAIRNQIMADPVVTAVLLAFPGTTLEKIEGQ